MCPRSSGARSRRTAWRIDRQLRDLREGVMRVRLVPVGEIFRRMPFVVRDLAQRDRQEGAARAARAGHRDRQVPDRADDGSGPPPRAQRGQPRHRNAGGAQSPRARPPKARSRSARRPSATSVVARDRRRRPRRRRERRWSRARATLGLSGARTALMRRRTLLDLLCAPGFSTRERADRASGRGVGMAVVKTTVQELGGTLTLDTAPGDGTRFIDRAAADAGDHRRAHRAVGDRDVRGAAGRGARGHRGAIPAPSGSSRATRSSPYRGGVLPIVRLARCSGSSRVRGAALHVFVVGAGARRGRHRRRSHRRPARDRRARDRRSADHGRRHRRARPTSATAGRADSRSGGAGRQRRPSAAVRRAGGAPDATARDVAGRRDNYILFTRRRHGLRAAEPARSAHVEMVEQVTRVPNAPHVRRRRGVLARPGRAGGEPARALRVRAGRLRPAHAAARRPARRPRRSGLSSTRRASSCAIPAAAIQPPHEALTRHERPLSRRDRDDRRPADSRSSTWTKC